MEKGETAMNERPKLKIKKTAWEYVLDGIGLLAFLASLFYIFYMWSVLPVEIPIHFDVHNEPNGWGSRGVLFIIPAINLPMWVGMLFLDQYPHKHNYIWLTEENVYCQYHNSILLANVMRNQFIIFFSLVSWMTVDLARGGDPPLGRTALISFAVMLATMVFFTYRSYRIR